MRTPVGGTKVLSWFREWSSLADGHGLSALWFGCGQVGVWWMHKLACTTWKVALGTDFSFAELPVTL